MKVTPSISISERAGETEPALSFSKFLQLAESKLSLSGTTSSPLSLGDNSGGGGGIGGGGSEGGGGGSVGVGRVGIATDMVVGGLELKGPN
jgi:hypothetical protein